MTHDLSTKKQICLLRRHGRTLHLFPSVNWQRRDPPGAKRSVGSLSKPSHGFHQSSILPRSRLAVLVYDSGFRVWGLGLRVEG